MEYNSTWDSIYQTQDYCDILAHFFIKSEVLFDKNGRSVYFTDYGDLRIAWGVSPVVDIKTLRPTNDKKPYRLYQYSFETQYQDMNWSGNEDGYFTLILKPTDIILDEASLPNTYSRQFRRSLARATKRGITHAQLSHTDPIDKALSLFEIYPERRGGYSQDIFVQLVNLLMEKKLADLHVVLQADNGAERILGATVVLNNASQVNMRYYTAERENCAGHMLHHSVIAHYMNNHSTQIIDLSGLTHPAIADSHMLGINEFKLQTSQTVVAFKMHTL